MNDFYCELFVRNAHRLLRIPLSNLRNECACCVNTLFMHSM
ncbi:hypothetical protein SynSYN20_01521 [Synechococcus sp. SYN20]|nr:hypothetical protein SynSYN20_01521 [Synechococcus sp. SYN20]